MAEGIRHECEIAPLTLAPREESVFALALRESITNVIRHARATRCRVRVDESEGHVRLEVHDDGVGGERREGAGLLGMRTRVRELTGTFDWDGATSPFRCRAGPPILEA
jgi:two-component system sensor histidine kinase DesK